VCVFLSKPALPSGNELRETFYVFKEERIKFLLLAFRSRRLEVASFNETRR
jgi:hypothetical protein